VTDTQGHMLTGVVHEANIQDRDGAPGVISLACASFPCIVHVFADGGYAGEKLEEALAKGMSRSMLKKEERRCSP